MWAVLGLGALFAVSFFDYKTKKICESETELGAGDIPQHMGKILFTCKKNINEAIKNIRGI